VKGVGPFHLLLVMLVGGMVVEEEARKVDGVGSGVPGV
jgi:hypothetical protein